MTAALDLAPADPVAAAVARAVEEFAFGDLVPKAWIVAAFGLRHPDVASYPEHVRFELAFLDRFERFAATLLHEHGMALWSKRNGVWLVLHPRDQAAAAARRAVRETRKAVRRALDVATHTRVSALTATEAAAHEDTTAKLANFEMLVRTGSRKLR